MTVGVKEKWMEMGSIPVGLNPGWRSPGSDFLECVTNSVVKPGMKGGVVDQPWAVSFELFFIFTQVEQLFPGFDPLSHRPVGMIDLSKGRVNVGVPKRPGKVDRGHHGVRLGASAVRPFRAGYPEFGLTPQRMEQKQLQKIIKGVELWMAANLEFNAVDKRYDGRFDKRTRQIKPTPEFETNSHKLKIWMPRYNLLNRPVWHKRQPRISEREI